MSTDLELGSKGPEVVIWQNFLSYRGLKTTPDGQFGPLTVENTKTWQNRANLPPTGVVDDQTVVKASDYGLSASAINPRITSKPIQKASQSSLDIYPAEWDRIDKINASKLARVSPTVALHVTDFITEAKRAGVRLQVVQGLRTFAEQDALYAQGRNHPGRIVTNARGGQSLHNYGLAVDLAPVVGDEVIWDDSKFKTYGNWASQAGLDWGGNWKKFKDMPHVQDTDHMDLAHVQNLYREGGLAKVWANIT
jgi:LAS superfamily LD-carboxypeptidase LdcB